MYMYINVLCDSQYIQTVGSRDVRNVIQKYLIFKSFYFPFVFLKIAKTINYSHVSFSNLRSKSSGKVATGLRYSRYNFFQNCFIAIAFV